MWHERYLNVPVPVGFSEMAPPDPREFSGQYPGSLRLFLRDLQDIGSERSFSNGHIDPTSDDEARPAILSAHARMYVGKGRSCFGRGSKRSEEVCEVTSTREER